MILENYFEDIKCRYFEEIKWRFINDVMRTNENAKDNDVNKNHTNYGRCTCWVQVLRDIGHEVKVTVYEDNGVLKIPFVSIDNETIQADISAQRRVKSI